MPYLVGCYPWYVTMVCSECLEIEWDTFLLFPPLFLELDYFFSTRSGEKIFGIHDKLP